MDCFITKFKLEYDNLENPKTDRVNAVVFNLRLIKRLKLFLGHPVRVGNIAVLLCFISVKICFQLL